MSDTKSIIVVGAGIFGVTAALELQQRGHKVKLFDPGPLPHPDASSTDISKVLRMDYGSDELYMKLMEEAFEGWDRWNKELGETVFHQTGYLMLSRESMQPGGFEHDSFQLLQERGHTVDRLDTKALGQRFPAWKAENYPDGYFNPRGGWAPSGRVVQLLIKECEKAGVELHEGKAFAHLLESGSKVSGIKTKDGEEHSAELVIIAAGAWTPALLPHLSDLMWTVGQPVIHFKPENHTQYQPPQFPVWAADIGNTGWYGFPAKDDGTLKLANHGPGWRVDPFGERLVPDDQEAKFREFFAYTFPGLVNAPKIGDRLCLYCDTWDTDFYIALDPEREGLMLSTGGSGHGFKFAPMLGKLAADVVEGKDNQYDHRFAWRSRGDSFY